MKRSSIIFLQIVIVLLGVSALVLLIWEPHLEGRNAHSSFLEIYFRDPFLAYTYIGSIPFFTALYQSVKALGYVGQNKVFSPEPVKALRNIKYCALTIIGFVVGAELYFFFAIRGKDDIAGGAALGILIIFVSVVTATAAAMFEQILQNAVDIKSENDLTV